MTNTEQQNLILKGYINFLTLKGDKDQFEIKFLASAKLRDAEAKLLKAQNYLREAQEEYSKA
jgi:hypothetical protein